MEDGDPKLHYAQTYSKLSFTTEYQPVTNEDDEAGGCEDDTLGMLSPKAFSFHRLHKVPDPQLEDFMLSWWFSNQLSKCGFFAEDTLLKSELAISAHWTRCQTWTAVPLCIETNTLLH